MLEGNHGRWFILAGAVDYKDVDTDSFGSYADLLGLLV